MKLEQIAQVAYEINAAYCTSIGDNSFTSWDDAPEWQKSTIINGVKFHLENPDASPSASHESWLKQKTEEGWKYGAVKNPETKEHPCFVPYEELPTEQKSKDYLFKQIIHSLKDELQFDAELKKEPKESKGREMTFGEKLVGLTFNPSNDAKVQRAKELCAELADLVRDGNEVLHEDNGVKHHLLHHTYGEILNAQMNVVKVLTLKH